MGCSISCSYFEMFSTFLEWIVRQVESVLHYLDDFLFVGPPGTWVCSVLLQEMVRVCRLFGVPLAPEKTEGPATVVKFLGIVIDTVRFECRLPEDKLRELRDLVGVAIRRRKLRLRELQSLLGRLNFACRIMPMGRVFCRRLAAATAGVRRPLHFVRLHAGLREDLAVWGEFLARYNGRSLVMGPPVSNVDLELFTDAAGGAGFGAYFQGQWCAGEWPVEWRESGVVRNLALLELFPIVVATVLWGDRLRDRRVRFLCDNLGVVQAINSQSANSPPVVRLLRRLVLRGLELNAHFVAVHLPGTRNVIADSISRFQWSRFRELAPQLVRQSLADSTWDGYSQCWSEWEDLVRQLNGDGVGVDWDATVLYFVGSAFVNGVSSSGLSRRLAALAFWFKWRGLQDFTKSFLVRQAVRGFKRGLSRRDRRRPLPFGILNELLGVLGDVCGSEYEVLLFRLAFSLAFFGAFRVSELVSPSRRCPGGLGLGDCRMDGEELVCLLRRSKTDREGRGLVVRLRPLTDSVACPVNCFAAFMAVRPAGGGALLVHGDLSCLSKFQFVQVFRKGLERLGISPRDYSSHSFRIGAATEAARWGLPPTVIRRIGRWESERYRLYVRPGLL
ncbi:uncharacterized protein RB166_010897 [Leptodactylus fuscus]